MVLALADGATCLSDRAAMRAQPAVFGSVGSELDLGPPQSWCRRCGQRAAIWLL
jgi:hypothetical protein